MPIRRPPTGSPRAMQEPEDGWLEGCARESRPMSGGRFPVVRLVFLALMLANGLGAVAYPAWVVMPATPATLDGASRSPGSARQFLRLVAFGLVAVYGRARLRVGLGYALVRCARVGILWAVGPARCARGVVRCSAGRCRALVTAGVVALIVSGIRWVQGSGADRELLLLIREPRWRCPGGWPPGAPPPRSAIGRIAEQARAELATRCTTRCCRPRAHPQCGRPRGGCAVGVTEERGCAFVAVRTRWPTSTLLAAALRHAAPTSRISTARDRRLDGGGLWDGMTPTTDNRGPRGHGQCR